MITQAMLDVLFLPNFALKISSMMMVAMFAGAILVETWRRLRIVIFILILFIIFQAWIHDTLIDNTNLATNMNHVLITELNIVMSALTVALWAAGMWLGLWIVTKTREPYEADRLEMEAELETIIKRQPLTNLHEMIKISSRPLTKAEIAYNERELRSRLDEEEARKKEAQEDEPKDVDSKE